MIAKDPPSPDDLNRWLETARRSPYTREAMRDLARQLPEEGSHLDRLVGEAIERRDEAAYQRIVVSALGAGKVVSARHLVGGAALFEQPRLLLAVASRFTGDVARALLEAVDRGGMDCDQKAAALLAAAVWCQRRTGSPIPTEVVGRARALARATHGSVLPEAMLIAMRDVTYDSRLKPALGERISPPIRDLATSLRKWAEEPLEGSLLEEVPEGAPSRVVAGYTIRRAVDRVGRNAPCPCGSGKKYKKCCYERDQERRQNSSEVAGMTVEELRENPEAGLDRDRLQEMRSHQLVRLEPEKVPEELRPLLLQRLVFSGEVEAAVNFLERVPPREDLDGHWMDVLDAAVRRSRRDLVDRLHRLAPYPEWNRQGLLEDFPLKLLLSREESLSVLDLLEEEAGKALRSPGGGVQMAYDLLESRFPALGVFVARGALPLCKGLDAHYLLQALQEARDRMELWDPDPIDDVLRELEKRDAMDDFLKDLPRLEDARRKIREKEDLALSLQKKLERLQEELENRESDSRVDSEALVDAPEETREVDPHDEEIADLRRRLNDLKGELKHRHSQLRSLQRQAQIERQELEARLSQSEEIRESERDLPQQEEGEVEEEPTGGGPGGASHPPRVPVFAADFGERLGDFPRPIAAAALKLIGRLAAGDPSAYQGVKRLQPRRDVLRQKVGARHRVLFRIEGAALEVVALIHRKDLERTVKTIVRR